MIHSIIIELLLTALVVLVSVNLEEIAVWVLTYLELDFKFYIEFSIENHIEF